MGPFTQEDPIGLAGGIDLYGYANGDPVNFGDPFGLDPCDEFRDDDGKVTVKWAECKIRQNAKRDAERAREAA